MIVFFKPSFLKDITALPAAVRLEIKKICVEIFPAADTLFAIKEYDIKAMTGFKNYYRLRLGDYRMGFKKEKGIIIFMRVKHRKEIHRYFP